MNFEDKSRDELIRELIELQKALVEVREQHETEISRLLLAEEKMTKSEEKFRKAFFTSPDSININRLKDGMYISINHGFTKIMGYAEEEVIGKTSIELNIWENPTDRKKLVDGLLSSGEVENLEAKFISKNGMVIFGMMSAAIINLAGVPHILSVTRDITDRKLAAMALKESETRYRELIELAVDGILLGSSDGIIIGANTCIVNLAGRPLNQLLGMHVNGLFTHKVLENTPLRFDLLQKGEVVISERFICRPDGSEIPVEMHTKMMPDGTYQSIFHDITERKESENALRESEEWFRNLFEQSSDGILYLTLEGNIITVNSSFAGMHGYSIEEIMNMNIRDLDCPESRESYPERMEKLLSGENLKFEVEHFHKTGHRIPMEVTAGMISLGSKKFIMASHRDISERYKADAAMKFAKEKAEVSDRLKTTFLNNISHELRTPLNGIVGFAELITGNDLDPDERKEALSMVYDCSERLLDTVTNYMDISLLVSKEMNVNMTEFNPDSLLKELNSKYKHQCTSRNIELILNVPYISSDVKVNSDPELLKKVLTHLLNNAVKFTEKGRITFGYRRGDIDLEFFVSDTGIGIGKEALASIFNHFFKEEQVNTRSNEGSGLGLTIAKNIVELLGGVLNADSEKGKGTTCSFSLPLISGIRPTSETMVKKPEKRIRSILVAEDDETNFLYLKTLLRQSTQVEIIHASNGKELIEKFEQNRDVDLILMDMKMPFIDGFEATRKIKAINPLIPVIAVTAYAMVGDLERIMDAGCDDYLTKPIVKSLLLDKIAKFVSI
jgi:PAS domain S-box-containing protein